MAKPKSSKQQQQQKQRPHDSTPPHTQGVRTLAGTQNGRLGGALTEKQREGAQELFLTSFRRMGNVTLASRTAGINRSTIYDWLECDAAFSLRYEQAKAEAVDLLEAEAWRRGVQGTEKVVVSMGKIVTVADGLGPDGKPQYKPLTEREYSDTLLLNLLRAHNPKYRAAVQALEQQDTSTIRIILETDTREVPTIEGSVSSYGGEIGPPDDWS